MRSTIFGITLALLGCARSLPPLRESLACLTPTAPQPPLSAVDSILRLALEEAIVHGIPDFPPRPRVVIIRDSGLASARVLPRLDSVTFYLLVPAQIQALADRHGDMSYLLVGETRMQGDSAIAAIGNTFALRRSPGRGVVLLLAGGGCYWILRRHEGVWEIDRLRGCQIS